MVGRATIRKAREGLKDCIVRCPEGLCPLTWERFLAVCAVRRQSAPGPDGISYLAWNSRGEDAVRVLYECYLGIGGEVPAWLNCSTPVFIPKGDGEQHGVSV